MKLIFAVLLTLLSLLPAYGEPDDPKKNLRTAHGTFTGEMKALLYVTDVEKSAPFYRDVLGFEFQGFANLDEKPYYAEMIAGDVKFGLHEPTSAGQEARIGQQRLYFRVKDLQAQRSRVLAWGESAGKIKSTDWMDLFIVRDPDGNEIVFAVTDLEHHSINPWNTREPGSRGGKKTP